MKEAFTELTIPGRYLSLKGTDGRNSGSDPDLVLDLRSKDPAVKELLQFLSGKTVTECEAGSIKVNGNLAEFYLSGSFIARKSGEIVSADINGGDSLFREFPEEKKVKAARSDPGDFFIFYALSKKSPVGVSPDGESPELFFKTNAPALILAAVILSGLDPLFELKTDDCLFKFRIKPCNSSRLAAELFYLAEKEGDGRLPSYLAGAAVSYISRGISSTM